MTDLEKKLILLNRLGIWIEYADGHTWIRSEENYNGWSYSSILKSHGVSVNTKIYGGLEEALDVVDRSFELMGIKPLLSRHLDEETVTARSRYSDDRVEKK